MTVGIPGAGIGGLFYLLSALWMPFREFGRIVRGESSRESRRMVFRQVSMALAILASMSAAAWAINRAMIRMQRPAASVAGAVMPSGDLPRVFSYSALTIGVATLAFILLVVHVLRL